MTISAEIIAHSRSSITGKEIVTYRVTHHRFILAEMNKHRMLSNSYQSSRAVPVEKMIDMVRNDPAMPVHWGKKQAGMQANEECDEYVTVPYWSNDKPKHEAWAAVGYSEPAGSAMESALQWAEAFNDAGYAKQIVNRLTEPFQWTTGIITSTEWDNFFYLRRDKAAQPEFKALADKMWEALQESEPEVLAPGEWHTPFISHFRDGNRLCYGVRKGPVRDVLVVESELPLEKALQYSAASCAQISFRKLDQSIETLERVWDRCFNSGIPHAVVAEHQAMVMHFPTDTGCGWEDGVTHLDINGDYWSGNFKHFVQHRNLIPNNVCNNYKEENE